MEGCDYTNSCGMDSTHSTWSKWKGGLMPGTGLLLSCLQLFSNRLVASSSGLVCVRSGFFGMHNPASVSHRHITALQNCLQGRNVSSLSAGRDYRLSITVPISCNITAELAQLLSLSSLITMVGIVGGTATQLRHKIRGVMPCIHTL